LQPQQQLKKKHSTARLQEFTPGQLLPAVAAPVAAAASVAVAGARTSVINLSAFADSDDESEEKGILQMAMEFREQKSLEKATRVGGRGRRSVELEECIRLFSCGKTEDEVRTYLRSTPLLKQACYTKLKLAKALTLNLLRGE
jgi:hypothetical protein